MTRWPSPTTIDFFKHPHVRPDRSAPVNAKRLRLLTRCHSTGRPGLTCSREGGATCDAASLAAEVARQRAWADFASDLLDAHIWGFGPGDWQASEALAHALVGSDWPLRGSATSMTRCV